MSAVPSKLQEILDDFALMPDRTARAEHLIEIADRFDTVRVPPEVAQQPYDERHRVPACESEAFVWALDNPDGTLTFRFDVLNPQGLSAMALAVILGETCSGAPLEQVANVHADIVFTLFGKEISMGKGQGLTGLVSMVQRAARQRLAAS